MIKSILIATSARSRESHSDPSSHIDDSRMLSRYCSFITVPLTLLSYCRRRTTVTRACTAVDRSRRPPHSHSTSNRAANGSNLPRFMLTRRSSCRYACDQCDFGTSTKRALKAHMTAEHTVVDTVVPTNVMIRDDSPSTSAMPLMSATATADGHLHECVEHLNKANASMHNLVRESNAQLTVCWYTVVYRNLLVIPGSPSIHVDIADTI